jgi:hypothetical protein
MTYLATPVDVDLPGVTSRSLLGGSVLRIGEQVTDVGEEAVVDLRTRLMSVGALRPIA